MNLEVFWGLGGAMVIREIIDVIKPSYEGSKLAGLYNVAGSILIGVLLSVSLSFVLGKTIEEGLFYGVLSGLLAPVWHQFVQISK